MELPTLFDRSGLGACTTGHLFSAHCPPFCHPWEKLFSHRGLLCYVHEMELAYIIYVCVVMRLCVRV